VNPDSYFENDPWAHLLKEVKRDAVGKVVAVNIQAGCLAGNLDRTVQEWQTRLDSLLGQPERHDVLRNGPAVSLLLRYSGPVIGRVFVDERADSPFANVEIVGAEGLLVWKPDVHALSVITSAKGIELAVEQAYAVELTEARL
jgi:hypothetical protein